MIRDLQILTAIEKHSGDIKIPDGVNIYPEVLLAGMCGAETTWGRDQWQAREEKGYSPGGYYYVNSHEVRRLYDTYGDLAARSWSAWQIMYPTARELGFLGHPWQLTEPDTALKYVVRYLNRRTFVEWSNADKARHRPPAKTVGQVGDSYNSGNHWDDRVPHKYIRDLEACYKEALEYYRPTQGQRT